MLTSELTANIYNVVLSATTFHFIHSRIPALYWSKILWQVVKNLLKEIIAHYNIEKETVVKRVYWNNVTFEVTLVRWKRNRRGLSFLVYVRFKNNRHLTDVLFWVRRNRLLYYTSVAIIIYSYWNKSVKMFVVVINVISNKYKMAWLYFS